GGVAEGAAPVWIRERVRRPPGAPHVEDVAVPVGGEERDLRKSPREDRVQPRGARVVEQVRLAHARRASSLENAELGVGDAGGDLDGGDRPVADRNHAGERSAYIDPDHQRLSTRRLSGPSRCHGSRETDVRQVWHLTTWNQPPSLRTGYRLRSA